MGFDLTTAVATHTCRSVEEQASLLDAWNQSYCQISRGSFDGSIVSFAAGSVRIHVERLNRTVYQRGEVARDRIAVGIPFQLEGHALLCGETSHRDALHVFSGSNGFEFLSPDRHLVVNLEITAADTRSDSVREQLREIGERLAGRAGIRNAEPLRLDAFRTTLAQMLSAIQDTPALLDDPQVAASLERSAVFGLADVLPDPLAHDAAAATRTHLTHRTARHWQLVRAVRELVEGSPDGPLTVAELCVRLRASRRTLQYAFEASLGVNPFTYMRAVRLGHARRELQRADTVTEAATRWGFWHLGNFSNEYREQFGELPSETLRRHRGHG
ncbi:helix-turn-helix domain-containing protein [Burkholderia sp. 22PA0106]|uniref:helix-turn-helix domain-containing protein n=1 Tax=Burkholderia sp. 22PA0106 TaxID=3237371 RepID=UPI0039C3B3C8